MTEAQIRSMRELPANATNADALEWVVNQRRILDRWDDLPDAASRSMTPELRKEAHEELDIMERMIRDNMVRSEGA